MKEEVACRREQQRSSWGRLGQRMQVLSQSRDTPVRVGEERRGERGQGDEDGKCGFCPRTGRANITNVGSIPNVTTRKVLGCRGLGIVLEGTRRCHKPSPLQEAMC